MSLKENTPETTPGRTSKVIEKADTVHTDPESCSSGDSDHPPSSSKTQMDDTKNTKVTTAESSVKKPAESKEDKMPASRSDEDKDKAKDNPADKEQAGVLAEGFCGFEDVLEPPVLTRSTREASRNATAILTKKSSAKLEKAEKKSDSPPDLVLFLKEGRGRAQTYSDPPRLDPESIATRRRTRVPEDPMGLIAKKSTVSAEKTKKDQKESTKKERKTKVMETPESLKRLAREGSKLGQTSGKESSDSGSEEKTLRRTYSKCAVESDIKVRSRETSTGSEEEHPAGISRRSTRGKRNSADEPEMELGKTSRTGTPTPELTDESTNYSNLGTILNKMSKNNADRRIPVVIMSKSEKPPKNDAAKPKSKKKVALDPNVSTAVLKIASPAIPTILAMRSSDRNDDSLSEVDENSMSSESEYERSGKDSEPGQDVIVLKVTSDLKSEGKIVSPKTKTVNSISSKSISSASEKVQMKQAKTDNVLGVKEAAVGGSPQPSVLRAVQGSSSPIRFNQVSPPIRSALVPSPIKPSLIISSVSSNRSNLPMRPRPLPTPVMPSTVISHGKPKPIISSNKSSPVTSSIKPGVVMSSIKSGKVTSPIKTTTVTASVKSTIMTSPVKSGIMTSSIKSGIVTSPVKPGSVMHPIKYASATSPTKPASITLPNTQGQKNPPFVVSMSQIVSFGGVKGSVKMTNFTPSKMGLKVSSTKGASTSTQNLKIAPKPVSTTNASESSVAGDKCQSSQAFTQQVANPSSQKGPMLDYTDIETQEVVLGESEDSNGQMGSVGDMPAETDLVSPDEMESSSEEDSSKVAEVSVGSKKESLSPEGRVALDHCYSSGGSSSGRKKSPSTYEKSLTPRPVYSNASTAKRSLDIMLHNDKINILRQMSQIFNDEKPPLQIFSDEKTGQSETDITVSSSDGEEEADICTRKAEENSPLIKSSSKTVAGNTTDSGKKGTSPAQTLKASSVDENASLISKHTSSSAVAEPNIAEDTTISTDADTSSGSASSSSNKENSIGIESTPSAKEREEENVCENAANVSLDSPFLGFPDNDPKVHHVPAYSPAVNEKIMVQTKVGPAGEMIDIVDGFSFTSFASEQEMLSYVGTWTGRITKAHRQWLKRRRKRRKRLMRQKRIRPVVHKLPEEQLASNVAMNVASPKDKGSAADSGAFASDDLDTFLDKNSRLNISYPIPKCQVTEDGVSKIEDELLDPTSSTLPAPPPPPPPPSPPPLQSQTRPSTPVSPHSSSPPPSPSSPDMAHADAAPTESQAPVGVNPNTSALEQHVMAGANIESVDQYEEVNAIDILYPKEKYKYYYNKELCKETKADASDVFVRRGGKLVPLSTIFKSQKCPPVSEPTTKKSVEIVYVYDGGKLLTLGGSLTKINPSNSDSVRARVVLPIGVPPIARGETVAARAKQVQAVEINEDLAKFALSALQSPHLKSEEAVDKKDCGEEECPSVSGPSSSVEEKMEVDEAEAMPVKKTELAPTTKAPPAPVSIKPTKKNILDIIAAKLAMSDEESDGNDEAEEKKNIDDVKEAASNVKQAAGDVKKAASDVKEAASDVKEAASDVKEAAGDVKEAASDVKGAASDVKMGAGDIKEIVGDKKETVNDVKEEVDDLKETVTKPSTVEEKKEDGATVKEEDEVVEICQTSSGTLEKGKDRVEQEDLEEEMSEDTTPLEAEDVKEGEAIKVKVEVKQEGELQTKTSLSDDVDDMNKEQDKLTPTDKVGDLPNLDGKEDKIEPLVGDLSNLDEKENKNEPPVKENKTNESEEIMESSSMSDVTVMSKEITPSEPVIPEEEEEEALRLKGKDNASGVVLEKQDKETEFSVSLEKEKETDISKMEDESELIELEKKGEQSKLIMQEDNEKNLEKDVIQVDAGTTGEKTTNPEEKSKEENTTLEEEENTTLGEEENTTLGEEENTTLGEEENTTLGEEENTTLGEEENTTLREEENTTLGEEENTTLGEEENTTLGEEENTTLEEEENSSKKTPLNLDGNKDEEEEEQTKQKEVEEEQTKQKEEEAETKQKEEEETKQKEEEEAETKQKEEEEAETKQKEVEEAETKQKEEEEAETKQKEEAETKQKEEEAETKQKEEEEAETKQKEEEEAETKEKEEEAEKKQNEDSTLNEESETRMDITPAAELPTPNLSGNAPTKICEDNPQDSIVDKDNATPSQTVHSALNADAGTESPKSSLLSSSQESGDRIDFEEKEEAPESCTPDTFRMDIKARVFKKNMYRFPSLSREMKRLNMNFVSYVPPQESIPKEEEPSLPEIKEDCTNEHCKLGCVCDSLSCQRKSVEHCGRIECMFDCTCRDESWKLPSGSGRTMNAVSIFNLDREQNEGLAVREKDFKRTVIQTGTEVILVGAERKKREIRLPGRYRETTVWNDPDVEAGIMAELPNLTLQPDYPGIPLSEASKYIKKFKLNIPWYDVKGISIWCMDHSCYDCRCITDPTFNDSIKVESPRKSVWSRTKPEVIHTNVFKASHESSTILKSSQEFGSLLKSSHESSSPVKCSSEPSTAMKPSHEPSTVPKSSHEPSTSTSSALLDLEEALKQKTNPEDASVEDTEVKKVSFIVAANCSIVNIIVNNSETRRKYTWKLKEWYHCSFNHCARTAGYSKKNMTEETKNMNLTGLAARDTTPEQIVESVVRTLRQQKSNAELKLPTLPSTHEFEPFMGDSLTNLQNAIGLKPDTNKKLKKGKGSCPVVDLTTGLEETSDLPKDSAKSPKGTKLQKPKTKKGVSSKRKLSGSVDPLPKRALLTKSKDATGKMTPIRGNTQLTINNYPSNSKELTSLAEQKLAKRTLSLLEMMVAEENRGELELDLSDNIPGNALLVAEARFRKLINMNIIGVIGINKAGRCIIGTVDSDEALQVMHQIQNMIRNNTLDVGPNMREIFFPPPYVGIRPRYVMIRCDSHRKWEIVGVVQKKGPVRATKASEAKAKAHSPGKLQVPQVIDLEEEEREKQMLIDTSIVKQEESDFIEPPSPEDKDSGTWEGSLPLITSVHGASDTNMAELIGSPEAIQEESEEFEEPQLSQTTSISSSHPSTPKLIPDLVPITSPSPDTIIHGEEQGESLSMEAETTESENASQQKLYFVPTGFNVSNASTSTIPSIPADTPMKSITLNVASNKIFGKSPEKSASSPRSYSYGKVSYILPKLPGPGKTDSSILPSKQTDLKNPTDSKAEDQSDADSGQTPSSSKMLYIPVTTGSVSKVLLVPTVSGGPSRMMLLPTIPGSSPIECSSTNSATTTTTTIITTPISSSSSTAAITTSKMKMVFVPSSQDSNKMLLIPAPGGSDDSAGSSSVVSSIDDGERKKMLVLPSSVINNFMSRPSRTSSETTSTRPYQQSCKGTLLVPLPNTGNLPSTSQSSETDKCSEGQQEESNAQDNSDDVVVIDPTSDGLSISSRTSSESCTVRPETAALLMSPAPYASSSGVAETNVVSSLSTISSTMLKSALLPEVKNGSDSQELSSVQQSSGVELNSIFDKTHEEMVSGTQSVEKSVSVESTRELICESEQESMKESTKIIVQNQDSNIGKAKDVQDEKKQVLIKKGGFHWSAVDLSLNFKSVKLEWLLGTIRKNVLMNIYQMSKKTLSPVTLSVKNGTSTSMLYGFARACKTSTMPILILGSVVSAVLSSSSVSDSMLFQMNSIKYFIRETSGELSSYTYASETHLVKLASKKRGYTGEMLGIGQKIEIDKMRDPIFMEGKGHCSLGFARHPSHNKKSCTCTEDFVCEKHCDSSSSLKQGVESIPVQYPSEDTSSRASLENDLVNASLGSEDGSIANTHQEDVIEVNSKPATTTKKLRSELHHLLTKPKDLSSKKKTLVDIESLIAGSNKDDVQIMGEKLTPGVKPKLKGKEESSSSIYLVAPHQSDMEDLEESVVPKVECETEDEVVDIDVLGDTESSHSILNNLRQQLELETTQVQKIAKPIPPFAKEVSKKKKSKMPHDGPPMKKAKTSTSPGASSSGASSSGVLSGASSSGLEQASPQSKKAATLTAKGTKKGAKLKYLNLEEKLKVLDRVDSGASMQEVCAEFGLKSSTFYDIKKKRDKIRMELLGLEDSGNKVRKVDLVGPMEIAGKEELEDNDTQDPTSRFPSRLAHQQLPSGDSPVMLEENDSDICPTTKGERSTIRVQQSQLMAVLSRNKPKEKMIFEGEGQNDDRNTELHNKLERMRRKVMRHLFVYLQNVIIRVPRNPLVKNTLIHPKKSVLNAGSKVCDMLRIEEEQLMMEEDRVRNERSALIKQLAGIIGDSAEEIKVKWRIWVKEHMQNPTAKQTFENSWQPLRLMEDILKNVVEENNCAFDMDDDDEGSPLPAPSSPQSSVEKVKVQVVTKQKVKRPYVRRKKRGRKVGRPHKVVVNTGQGEPEVNVPLPTSILLMAGTSSRGRKIVRKEDTNFVTS